MNHRIFPFYIIFYLMIGLSCDTKNNIAPLYNKTFIKLYGDADVDQACDFIALENGGYAIIGTTRNIGVSSSLDVLFILTDSIGNIIQQKKLGDPSADEVPLRLVYNKNNSEYIICGNSSDQSGNQEGFLWKVKPDQDSISSSQYFPDTKFSDMTTSADGQSLALTGTVTSGNTSYIAEKLINDVDYSLVGDDQSTQVGSGIKVGQSTIPELYQILNYDASGLINIKIADMQSEPNHFFYSGLIGDTAAINNLAIDLIHRVDNGNFYVLGYCETQGPFISEVTAGTVSGNHYLGINKDLMPAVLFGTNDGFLVLGSTQLSVSGSSTNIRLLHLDFNYNIVSDRTFGTNTGDAGVKMAVLPDKSVVFLATVNYQQGRSNNTKIALYKLSPGLDLDF